MPHLVQSLQDVRMVDAGRIGRKAAACAELLEAGFQVPHGVCLTVDAFQLALADVSASLLAILQSRRLVDPQDASRAALELQTLLSALEVPSPILEQLREALAASGLDDQRLAVRSSALSEDLPGGSMAGHYRSVLGVQGLSALQDAILTCWRAAFEAPALAAHASIENLDGLGMGVLIQPLIEADCSGVCFSLDPVQLETERSLVSAAWGLGYGVVEGEIPTDSAWVRRRDFEVEETRISEKMEKISIAPGGETTRETVEKAQQRAACLPPAWLERIVQTGLAAEALFGCPQDVEWAVEGSTVWVLQSRPIGSPGTADAGPGAAVSWESPPDRQNFWMVDNATGKDYDLLLPLELSEACSLTDVNQDTVRLLGAESHSQRNLVFRARVYYCPTPSGLSDGDIRIRLAAYDDLTIRLKEQDQTHWEHFGPEVMKATQRLAAFQLEGAGGPELAAHLDNALAARRRHSIIHPMIAFKPPRSYFQAFEELSGQSGPDSQSAAYRLVEIEGTISSRITDELYGLALTARSHPSLTALVSAAQPNTWEELAELERMGVPATFREQLAGFLERYGARNGAGYGSEANVTSPTWREQPELVLRMAAPYLDGQVRAPADTREMARQARDKAVAELCRGRSAGQVSSFRAELAYACRRAGGVEEHNHYIDQLSRGQLRHAILAAADWLAHEGRIASAGDVFWLNFEEIHAALRAKDAAGSSMVQFGERIKSRQQEYVEWRKLPLYPVLGRPDPHLPDRPPYQDDVSEPAAQDPFLISGIGASAGTIQGIARVVSDAAQLDSLHAGDILVTHNVGPRWTPFFPILGGLVLDGGSLGQHAAVNAREYRIPAVISTQNATRRIRDGEWIVIDGVKGTVQILRTSG